jgi:phosphoglycolate phosphatase-like HAD superfamily hydrolase
LTTFKKLSNLETFKKALNFQNYDTVIFDLDDTLYPEIAYLTPAFQAIGQYFDRKHGLDAIEVGTFLTTNFIKNGRQNLFNQCFNQFFLPEKTQNTEGSYFEKNVIDDCLNILRTVEIKEKIALFLYAYRLIPQFLAEKKQIFVLTNGNVQQQKNKIRHLDWQNLDRHITVVFANEYAPKPSSKVFSDFLEPNFHLKNKKTLFIGDAKTDAEFSQNVGFDFLHVDFLK